VEFYGTLHVENIAQTLTHLSLQISWKAGQ